MIVPNGPCLRAWPCYSVVKKHFYLESKLKIGLEWNRSWWEEAIMHRSTQRTKCIFFISSLFIMSCLYLWQAVESQSKEIQRPALWSPQVSLNVQSLNNWDQIDSSTTSEVGEKSLGRLVRVVPTPVWVIIIAAMSMIFLFVVFRGMA